MAETESLAGTQFGGYQLLEEIGRGGMAVVYRAVQISMSRPVAVKVLPRQFIHDKTFRERFKRGASIVAKLEHRAIGPVYDYGEENETPYIVMRYMDAGSVDDLLDRGPLPPEQVERIARQVGAALDYAHSKGVLHRDLKPSNILLDREGDAYLTDFGIARMTGSSTITTSGVVGTPSYMSPEQAQGLKLDGRSDVYGLAVVLYEMLSGRRPYESDTPYSVAVMHVTAPIPSIRDVNPAISPAIDRVLQKGLEKNRERRYQTATALAMALSAAIRGEESDPSRIPTKPIVLPRPDALLTEPEAPPLVPPVYTEGQAAPRAQQPTPPSSKRVRASSVRRRVARPPRQQRWWVNVAIGALAGCLLFALLIALALLAMGIEGWSPMSLLETSTPTVAPSDSAEITVIPPSGVLPPWIPVLTETAAAQRTQIGSGDAAAATPSALAPADVLRQVSGRIVFYARRDGDAELFLLDLASGVELQLTDNAANDRYPAISPDGAHIAFVSNRDGDDDIYVMDIDGANVRQITHNDIEDGPPAWSPDGQTLYFASDVHSDGGHDLYRVGADGTDLFQLTDSAAKDMHPSPSPDGRYLVYSSGQRTDPETWEIYRLDLRTNDSLALTDNDANDWSPVYSPDGSRISFLRRGEGRSALWMMSADGRDQTLVYDGDDYEWGNCWSPDGRLLAFTSGEEDGAPEIYLLALGGSEARKITSEGGAYPAWTGGTLR